MSASREKAVKSLEQIKAENEKKVQEIKESSKYYKTAKPGSLAEKAGMVAKYNEKNTKKVPTVPKIIGNIILVSLLNNLSTSPTTR